MTAERVQFHGVDVWNRPVFKSLDRKNQFFGSVDILVNLDATEAEVLAKVDAQDLTWFGTRFDCEPMGSAADVVIVKKS
jgi:hypothetical protein